MADVELTQSFTPAFSIKTEVFEGPLDLLVELIEKRKLLINDISLASVTDEYMHYVAEMQEHALKETAHFVVIASTLLLIKSKSLLPVLELTDEEEDNIEDLQQRLREYQVFREAAKTIQGQFGTSQMYAKRFHRSTDALFITDAYCTPESLATAVQGVVEALPKPVEKPKVRVKQVVSLEDTIERLKERVERQMRFRFTDFAGKETEKRDVIVSFLAVLEMVKQGTVMVNQLRRFDDIEIERDASLTPRYM